MAAFTARFGSQTGLDVAFCPGFRHPSGTEFQYRDSSVSLARLFQYQALKADPSWSADPGQDQQAQFDLQRFSGRPGGLRESYARPRHPDTPDGAVAVSSRAVYGTRMASWKHHIVLDVEADGPCPGLYNMISFGLVCVGDPAMSFLGEVAPILDSPGIARARQVSGISFEDQQRFARPDDVISAAIRWIAARTGDQRAIFWSDNPAFDWQYWNYYCHRFAGHNPAGFSARRIGDLDAGRRSQPLNTSAWKKHRATLHTHNPVDDARGNAEALRWILEQMGQSLNG